MKKVKLLGVLFISGLVISSCEKNELVSVKGLDKNEPAVNEVSSDGVSRSGGGTVIFREATKTLSQTNGEYSCPSPASDCTVIKPKPVDAWASPVHSNYQEFLNAVANHTVAEFFKTKKWESIFPHLNSNKQIIRKLQNEEIVFLRKSNSTTPGNAIYIAVPSNITDANFTISDALFAMDVQE